ncbi:site-specific recombinase XerD [Flavobacterium araucananum]|uniref:Integrase n=1 Tax=Flavobacterium araucananum TaxID=946678 RepID=A0A227P7W5_9FLAO|nr:tyrosine-type recombinase/integrase [Flavobacterium araucananum]OXG05338.1 integrase [Flavobacterium araucananum]PWJ93336.1 site-specific recombinase XerD [Flavobacterium araucananum]
MTKQTLEQFLLQNYSPQTVSSYLFAINHFLKLNTKAKRYKYVDIVKYMDEISLKQSNGKYRVVILSAIKKYYDYLVMSGYRNDHPCKRLNIKVNSNQAIQVQDLFSSSELQLLLERENRYKHLDVRNNVLLSLLIYQGLTSDELIRLNVKDIDLDNGTVYIKASINLNKRTMNLVPRQMILFFNYLQETRPQMLRSKTEKLIITKLGKPITVGGIHGMIDPLRALFPDRKLNPQTIRMSVICNWLNEKNISLEKAQELAGHKWPGTTEKYIKVNSSHQREIINRYFPF